MIDGKKMVISILCVALVACGKIERSVDKAVDVIDRTVSKLETESANWQDIVNTAINDLPSDLQTANTQLEDTLRNAISASGAELRCNSDIFLQKNIIADMLAIKDALLEDKTFYRTPTFCHVTPNTINYTLVKSNMLPSLTIWGYNLFHPGLTVFIEDELGSKREVTDSLNIVTHYEASLNLGQGAIGSKLKPTDKKIIIYLNKRPMSTLGILQPIPQPKPISNQSTYYDVTITTGNKDSAGTSARVYLSLEGSDATTKETKLDISSHDDFESGSTMTYKIKARKDIGNIDRIHVRHDNTGKKPGWYLSKITVKNTSTKQYWGFSCNRWLATSEGDKKISRTLTEKECD